MLFVPVYGQGVVYVFPSLAGYDCSSALCHAWIALSVCYLTGLVQVSVTPSRCVACS